MASATNHPLTSLWREQPYRVLFPVGAVLAWAGVLHWFLLAVGLLTSYRPVFHAMTQIQAFMTCFALGFLFTFVPRRTKSAGPELWQMALAVLAPILTALAAWFEYWAVAQLAWLSAMLMLLQFLGSRLRRGGSAAHLPDAFVWAPISIASAVVFACVTGVAAAKGSDDMWLHDVGSGVVLQGLFAGLVLGVGSVLIPIVTRGDPMKTEGSMRGKMLHLFAAALFLASFWVEVLVSIRLGFALRAAVALGVLCLSAQLWRLPSLPGPHRWLVWLGAWCLPLGFFLVSLWPEYRKAGLHVVFIGCFATMAFAISSHVVRSHRSDAAALQRPARAIAMGLLFALALICRVLVDIDPAKFRLWLGISSGGFLSATLVWGALVSPRVIGRGAP